MKHRFNPQNFVHRNALLHLIGQCEQMNMNVTNRMVADWLGCTKASASKYLKAIAENGTLIMTEKKWRGDAKVYSWRLSKLQMNMYLVGEFKSHYKIFSNIHHAVAFGVY